MVMTICILIIMYCIYAECQARDEADWNKYKLHEEERRHRELMKVTRESNLRKEEERNYKVTRTVAKDADGRIIMQETVEGVKNE